MSLLTHDRMHARPLAAPGLPAAEDTGQYIIEDQQGRRFRLETRQGLPFAAHTWAEQQLGIPVEAPLHAIEKTCPVPHLLYWLYLKHQRLVFAAFHASDYERLQMFFTP